MRRSREGRGWCAAFVPAVALLAAAACGEGGGGADTAGASDTGPARAVEQGGQRPTPAPPRGEMDQTWRARLATFARDSLQFDSLPPGADTATFVSGADTTRVTFSPEKGAGAIPDTALHHGWVIGRVSVVGPNPPFGLPAGTSWVWADSTSGGWRMLHIPESVGDSLRTIRMVVGSMLFRDTDGTRAMYSSIDSLANWRCARRCCIGGYERELTDAQLDSAVRQMHRTAFP